MKKPLSANTVAARTGQSVYPAQYAGLVAGRTKRKLGDVFGLKNFGVNQTELAPGAISALRHYHRVQDEFIYVLEGHPTLAVGDEEVTLSPGDCYGFPAGDTAGHQVRNDSDALVVILEVGDRLPGDSAEFPDDDIKAQQDDAGRWVFTRRDGSAF